MTKGTKAHAILQYTLVKGEMQRQEYEIVRLRESNARLLEALKAVADHEHCFTEHTVGGLRQLARAAIAAEGAK